MGCCFRQACSASRARTSLCFLAEARRGKPRNTQRRIDQTARRRESESSRTFAPSPPLRPRTSRARWRCAVVQGSVMRALQSMAVCPPRAATVMRCPCASCWRRWTASQHGAIRQLPPSMWPLTESHACRELRVQRAACADTRRGGRARRKAAARRSLRGCTAGGPENMVVI